MTDRAKLTEDAKEALEQDKENALDAAHQWKRFHYEAQAKVASLEQELTFCRGHHAGLLQEKVRLEAKLAERDEKVASLEQERDAAWGTIDHLRERLGARFDAWQKAVDYGEEQERKLAERDEALQMLGGIHPDKIGDWEVVEGSWNRERMMRSFARDVLAARGGGE
jgi:chromosome segregation ATPase